MRRTAILYSLLASLELRGLVTSITSLREILSKFPLPHVLVDKDQCFVCRATYSLLADGRVDPTARVEAQGPIGTLQSVLGHTIADKKRTTTCAVSSTTFLDRPRDTSLGIAATVALTTICIPTEETGRTMLDNERFHLNDSHFTIEEERRTTYEQRPTTLERRQTCLELTPSGQLLDEVMSDFGHLLVLTTWSWLDTLK